MNVLELAQDILDKKAKFKGLDRPCGYSIAHQDHYQEPMFSVWPSSVWPDGSEPLFNAKCELVNDNGYEGDIEEARQALKEFLEGEV